MKTISIVNLKGGVGKTVTAVNMAAILAEDYGKKVLVIDADPQANATRFYGISEDANTIACIMDGLADDPYDCIYCTAHEGVDIVPSDISLITADIASVSKGVGAGRLRDFLNVIDEDARTSGEATAYDVVLIDCPPSFTAASVAAIAASDDVIIPVKVDAFSVSGMRELLTQISGVRGICPGIRTAGILVTMWHNSPAVVQGEALLRDSGVPVFRTVIRRSDKVDESTFARQPLNEYSRYSSAGRDYRALVAEYLEVAGV